MEIQLCELRIDSCAKQVLEAYANGEPITEVAVDGLAPLEPAFLAALGG